LKASFKRFLSFSILRIIQTPRTPQTITSSQKNTTQKGLFGPMSIDTPTFNLFKLSDFWKYPRGEFPGNAIKMMVRILGYSTPDSDHCVRDALNKSP